MCLLCHVSRKRGSIARLLTTAKGSCSCNAVAVESKGATNYTAVRAYAAQPQPSEPDSTGRVDGYVLHPTTLNPNILKAQYAVRGELYNKAVELAGQGREIIYTNGG
jgi:glutamate--glyoxylate aminotransferase